MIICCLWLFLLITLQAIKMGGEVVSRLEDFGTRLAGVEGCSRILQIALNIRYERVRAT